MHTTKSATIVKLLTAQALEGAETVLFLLITTQTGDEGRLYSFLSKGTLPSHTPLLDNKSLLDFSAAENKNRSISETTC
jgi:hypothetical protein